MNKPPVTELITNRLYRMEFPDEQGYYFYFKNKDGQIVIPYGIIENSYWPEFEQTLKDLGVRIIET